MAKKRKTSRSTPSERTSRPAAQSTLGSRATDTMPDFDYVRHDLGQIGIIAGFLFLFMIILYFILPFIVPLYA